MAAWPPFRDTVPTPRAAGRSPVGECPADGSGNGCEHRARSRRIILDSPQRPNQAAEVARAAA